MTVHAETFLGRMRQNTALALAAGASTAEVQAHLLAVVRGLSRPGADELADGAEVVEHIEALNLFRHTEPGGVSP